ncbi:MAG: hypothetical protein AAFY71_02255 [Bacteroidota bacterium]
MNKATTPKPIIFLILILLLGWGLSACQSGNHLSRFQSRPVVLLKSDNYAQDQALRHRRKVSENLHTYRKLQQIRIDAYQRNR